MHESSMDKKWRPSFRNDADPNCPGCHGTGVVGYEYCNRPHIRDCYCIQPQPANATSLGVERNDDGPNANPEPPACTAPCRQTLVGRICKRIDGAALQRRRAVRVVSARHSIGSPMSLCNLCAEPGACCQRFTLNLNVWESEGVGGAWREIQLAGFPFFPIEPAYRSGTDPEHGHYQTWVMGCGVLQENGRCGDYKNRPEPCRLYAPRTDALCVMSGQHRVPRLPLLPERTA